MTVALPANAPKSFEIKSANLPLVALRVKTAQLDELAAELVSHFGDVPGFFDKDPLVLDFSAAPDGDPTPLAFDSLLQVLRSHGLCPVAVKGAGPATLAVAESAGLVHAPDALALQEKKQAVTATPVPPPPVEALAALVIDKPLRSGQQVYARGRDLVVLSMVNPGAEVIADGHIHVYAPLRGKAMAGARGNTEARIFSLAMEPELVSIAGIYRTSEVPWPDGVRGKPTQVRLLSGPDGDKLVLDALKP